KGHSGLATTHMADRGVELPGSSHRAGALRGSTTRRTSLRVVQQTLARVEGLLAAGEDELLAAVATGPRPVMIHRFCSRISERHRGGPVRPRSGSREARG